MTIYIRMNSKIVPKIELALLLMGMLTLAFNIPQAESSEPPPIEWTRTYGGAGFDRAYSVVETSDGGYALAGWTYSFGAGESDFLLVKIAELSEPPPPPPPPVPEFPLGGAIETALALAVIFLWLKRRR